MQASDDFTTHTQSMVDAYQACGEIRHAIVSNENFETLYNPSTRKRENLEIDVLQSVDGVFHVMIKLPMAESIEDKQVQNWIAYRELDQETMVKSTCEMMGVIFEEPHFKQNYEIAWFAYDRGDVYGFEDDGLMVVVLKPV